MTATNSEPTSDGLAELYTQLTRADLSEALSLGIPGNEPADQARRFDLAEQLDNERARRQERAYAAADGTASEPRIREPFGLDLVGTHHGDLDRVIADPNLRDAVNRDLGYHSEAVFINDEDGQRWGRTPDRTGWAEAVVHVDRVLQHLTQQLPISAGVTPASHADLTAHLSEDVPPHPSSEAPSVKELAAQQIDAPDSRQAGPAMEDLSTSGELLNPFSLAEAYARGTRWRSEIADQIANGTPHALDRFTEAEAIDASRAYALDTLAHDSSRPGPSRPEDLASLAEAAELAGRWDGTSVVIERSIQRYETGLRTSAYDPFELAVRGSAEYSGDIPTLADVRLAYAEGIGDRRRDEQATTVILDALRDELVAGINASRGNSEAREPLFTPSHVQPEREPQPLISPPDPFAGCHNDEARTTMPGHPITR